MTPPVQGSACHLALARHARSVTRGLSHAAEHASDEQGPPAPLHAVAGEVDAASMLLRAALGGAHVRPGRRQAAAQLLRDLDTPRARLTCQMRVDTTGGQGVNNGSL